MKGGMFVSILDIQLIMDCSERTAQRHSRDIKRHYKKSRGRISIREFADYFEISEDEVIEYLKRNR